MNSPLHRLFLDIPVTVHITSSCTYLTVLTILIDSSVDNVNDTLPTDVKIDIACIRKTVYLECAMPGRGDIMRLSLSYAGRQSVEASH